MDEAADQIKAQLALWRGKDGCRELLKAVELYCQQEQARLYGESRLWAGQPAQREEQP